MGLALQQAQEALGQSRPGAAGTSTQGDKGKHSLPNSAVLKGRGGRGGRSELAGIRQSLPAVLVVTTSGRVWHLEGGSQGRYLTSHTVHRLTLTRENYP